jgi:hypothetical protein
MTDQPVKIALGGREWEVHRARLGGFLRLQQARESLLEGVKSEDNRLIASGLYAFLRVLLTDLTEDEFYQASWIEIAEAYLLIESVNILPYADEFAILRFAVGSQKKVPWDNSLRSALIWTHLIASKYGWSKADIENLWPEEAIALVQEIMADEQIEREFLHALSEVAYEYNKSTKKSRYKPMPRPNWMQFGDRRNKVLKTKLRREWLPVGNVIYPEGADEEKVH